MNLTPPLLAMMSDAKARPARRCGPVPKELSLHMPVAKLLREHCKLDWQWAHYPSGELRGIYAGDDEHGKKIYQRDIRTATKLKQMGLKRGRPEFELNSPDRGLPHYLELKRLGCGLTDDQQEFRDWCLDHHVPHEVAWTWEKVLLVFEQWGCLRIEFQPRREPS
jgi:hypothetical protein